MLSHLSDIPSILHALEQQFSISITHKDGRILYVNDKFCALSKYERHEIIGNLHSMFDSDAIPAGYFDDVTPTLEAGRVWKKEVHNKAKDGSLYSISATVIPIFNEKHEFVKYMSVDSDITEKVKTEKKLEKALKNEFKSIVKHLQNAIFKFKEKNSGGEAIITMIEGKLAEQLGLPTSLEKAVSLETVFLKSAAEPVSSFLKRSFQGEELHFELQLFNRFFLMYLSPFFEDGTVKEVIGTMIDITTRKKAEEKIHQMAHYDDLTGLANRRLFLECLSSQLEQTEAADPFAVMFLDLDRFKNVNDTFGHGSGDRLLRKVADRLRSCIRQSDIAARLSGDEYAVLLPAVSRETAGLIAERVCEEINQFFQINSLDVFISSSIGISMYPEDGQSADILLQNADAAMYAAKEKGKNTYQFFTADLHRDMRNKMIVERELHRAIEEQHFHLEYQPQFDLKTNQLVGMEALIRWVHPKIGFISPSEFIPIAEETGLIAPIGKWVLETACLQNKLWQNAGFSPVRIAVNVSLRQFMQLSFVEEVELILAKTGLAPQWLELEITESMTADVEHTQQMLTRLRSIGVHVSIDDFGTGYSSLSYLSRFPITKLKIDQSFVQHLTDDQQAIVQTVIDLGRNLHLTVIAEGVEKPEQAVLLQQMNCTEAQGFLFSKPLSAVDMEQKFTVL